MIRCPETNKCAQCSFPEYRDHHQPDSISWEEMAASGFEDESDNRMAEQLQSKIEYEEIRRLMDAENPFITQAFELKEEGRYSVTEIAERLNISPRNVYYYLSRAKAIGQKYNRES